jgi:uncharacterized membrane protein
MDNRNEKGPLITAGTLLGIGLGGLLDGILLHQVLQWHSMLSSRVAPVDLWSMKYNMMWDGLFHAGVWIITAVGLALLWRAGERTDVPWSRRTLVGSLALGWGVFNVVEGIIDHHLLDLHHVKPGPHQTAWDIGFLVFGALLIAAGMISIRRERPDAASRGRGGFAGHVRAGRV